MPWGSSVYIAISYKSNITISEYPDFGDVSWNSEGFHLLEECFWGTQGNLNSAKHSSNSILRSWRPPGRVPLVLRTGDYLWTRRDRPWIWNSLKLAYVKLAYIHIYFSSGGLLIPGALNDIHWIEKYGWHIACDWHQPYFLLQLIFGVSGVKPNRIFQKWWSRSHKNDRMMMFWALPKHWFTVDPMKV